MPIIVTKNGKDAIKVQPSRFEQEDELQAYIAANPDSLPLYEIREDIRLLILAREFPTNSGPIDALGVDQEGMIYVVETKLYKNPDKRLVVAQVLDYGASLWRTESAGSFLDQLEESCRATFNLGLREKLREYFELETEQLEEVVSNLQKNHHHGAFRFVVLMDKLHDQLRDLIIFLNQNARFDIFAVEMEYYKLELYEIVIPKLFGSEMKKEAELSSSGSKRRKWDESSYFADAAASLSKQDLEALRGLYDRIRSIADELNWGTGITHGSFSPRFANIGVRSPFSVYSDGVLQLSFDYITGSPNSETFRKAWTTQLLDTVGLKFDPTQGYQYLKKEEWLDRSDKFFRAFEKLLKDLR